MYVLLTRQHAATYLNRFELIKFKLVICSLCCHLPIYNDFVFCPKTEKNEKKNLKKIIQNLFQRGVWETQNQDNLALLRRPLLVMLCNGQHSVCACARVHVCVSAGKIVYIPHFIFFLLNMLLKLTGYCLKMSHSCTHNLHCKIQRYKSRFK